MLKFVKSAFRGLFEVILWVNLLLFSVAGGVVGHSLGNEGARAFLGIIVGLVLGFIIDVIVGGFIATILNMDENIEKLKNDIKNSSLAVNVENKTLSAKKESKKSDDNKNKGRAKITNDNNKTNGDVEIECSQCHKYFKLSELIEYGEAEDGEILMICESCNEKR
jgi:uncharacterized membrane protein required for colicin V production